MMMRKQFSDQEILRALDYCSDRPNRACAHCPLFHADGKYCDQLEYYAYQLIVKLQEEKISLQKRLDSYETSKKMMEEVFSK